MAEMEYLPGGIRERMEDLRNRRKLTLKEVAEKTGIDYSTLSRIENGNVKKVGDDVLLKLARFFGVSTDFLLGITNVPDKKNYTIEELGLTPEAARNLYTGAEDNRVINLLLAHPDFATLAYRFGYPADDERTKKKTREHFGLSETRAEDLEQQSCTHFKENYIEIQRKTEESLKQEENPYVPSCVAPRTAADRGMIIRWI